MVRQLTPEDLRTLRLDGIGTDTAVDSDDLLAILEERGHVVIDNGHNAAVLDHPVRSDLIIRITTPEDGWIPYALHNQDMIMAPKVDALGYADGMWFAVVERLRPLDDDMDWVPAAIATGVEAYPANANDPAFRRACAMWPGLHEFAVDCLYGAEDIRNSSNIMLRGMQIVVNDPFPAREPDEDDEQLALDWEIRPEPHHLLDGPS